MQQSEAFERQLRAHYDAIVAESFDRARHCMSLARTAQQAGNCAEVHKWMWSVRVLRMAAAEWRNKAQRITPMILCALWCLVGCAKVSSSSPREFAAAFDVQPAEDGRTVVWTLHFSLAQYHRFLDTTPDGAERESVRELIAAGLEMHHMIGCSPHEKAVTKLADGEIAFVGSCSLGAHAIPAGGI